MQNAQIFVVVSFACRLKLRRGRWKLNAPDSPTSATAKRNTFLKMVSPFFFSFLSFDDFRLCKRPTCIFFIFFRTLRMGVQCVSFFSILVCVSDSLRWNQISFFSRIVFLIFFLSLSLCVRWKSMAKSIRTLKCDTQLECEPFLDIIAVMNVSMQVERKFFAGQWSHEETGRIFRSGSLNPMFSFFFYYKKKYWGWFEKTKECRQVSSFWIGHLCQHWRVFFPSCIKKKKKRKACESFDCLVNDRTNSNGQIYVIH